MLYSSNPKLAKRACARDISPLQGGKIAALAA